jgi:hypothetical protein
VRELAPGVTFDYVQERTPVCLELGNENSEE